MIRAVASVALFSLVALALAQPLPPTYENLNAILWVQASVEYKANTTQTYRAAQTALLQGLRDNHWTASLEQIGSFENLPPAVIFDLDETVLDNSMFEAQLAASGEHYSDQAWTKWINGHRSGLVPGAMEFLQFAYANGVAVLYVTNRTCDQSKDDDPTVKLLRALHLSTEPIADRLLCTRNGYDTDKTSRRAKFAAKYRILLLLGDQLGDFLQIPPEFANLEGREKLFEAHQDLWGKCWFQLPNPMYGSWEAAVGYSVNEKLSRLKK
jgi:5'-nucleotidase (lipoprotein e(P4) family)